MNKKFLPKCIYFFKTIIFFVVEEGWWVGVLASTR
jgi:hypothetical protein